MTKAVPAPPKDPPNTQDISNYGGYVGRSEQLSRPAFEFQRIYMKLSWKKDSEIYRGKKERVKSIALKAKKESSDDETSTIECNQEMKRSHSDKGMRRKKRVTGNDLDAVIQIISLQIVQSHFATKIKRPSLKFLER
ncbi:hypothetical protein Tco_0481374 [Tanacetum coccineum]